RSTPQYDFLGGNGYLNLALGFRQTEATAGAGGFDTADLYDTAGSDSFTGPGSPGTLLTPGPTAPVRDFYSVRGTASAGGFDQLALGALDYVFQHLGPWH